MRPFVCQRRPRSYEAHVAPQHIEELRQLVQTELAQEAPDWRDAGIVFDLEENAIALVGRGQRCLHAVRADHHRPEFPEPEYPALFADALGHRECLSRRSQLDEHTDDYE